MNNDLASVYFCSIDVEFLLSKDRISIVRTEMVNFSVSSADAGKKKKKKNFNAHIKLSQILIPEERRQFKEDSSFASSRR